MKRLALLTAAAAACAFPASAVAAPSSGTVLTVNAGKHSIQLVDGSHTVHGYRYRGSAQSVRPGSKVHFKLAGGELTDLHASGRPARKVAFRATVTRATANVVSLRLGDGKQLSYKTRLVHATGTLAPKLTVMVTELLRAGRAHTVKVAVPHSEAAGRQGGSGGSGGGDSGSGSGGVDHSPPVSGPQDVNGTITQVSDSAVTITTLPGGQVMQFVADPDDDATDGDLVGDQVTVTYRQLADGALKTSDVEYLDQDVTGTVVSVTTGSVSILIDGTATTQTYVDDPSDEMFDGVNPGDAIDVTYHVAASSLVVDGIDDGGPLSLGS
jgi:hypothetical protein